MDDRLKFRGYATHDLNIAAQAFRMTVQQEPQAFQIRPGYDVYGARRYMELVIESEFAGSNGVYIPVELSYEELKSINATLSMRQKTSPLPHNIEQPARAIDGFERYCTYCGRLYTTSRENTEIHCGSPACTEKHEEYQDHLREMKALHGNGGHRSKSKAQDKSTDESPPDFSLDDPMSPLLRGWVYLIEADYCGLFKIGRSDDIAKRFGDLVAMSPVSLFLTHTIEAMNYVRAEEYLHKHFHDKRHHNEWFSLSSQDIEWIQGLQDFDLDRV